MLDSLKAEKKEAQKRKGKRVEKDRRYGGMKLDRPSRRKNTAKSAADMSNFRGRQFTQEGDGKSKKRKQSKSGGSGGKRQRTR
jgi:hypothetical protein